MSDERFYADLTPVRQFIDLVDPRAYTHVPRSWSVIITDIVGSTKAIEAGRYKDVNLLGAASIVAVVNALPERAVPFVFGGDGATILVPDVDVDAARDALAGLSRFAQEAFQLELRVGLVPVAELVDAGYTVQVTKLALSDAKELAMLWGTGIARAEKLIKDPQSSAEYAITASSSRTYAANLDGLSCRWEPLVNRQGRMLTLIALATNDDAQSALTTYRRVVDFLEETMPMGKPADLDNIHMGKDLRAFTTEATLRTGRTGGIHHALTVAWIRFETWAARKLIQSGKAMGGFDGAHYPKSLVRHTDFRKFDGALRFVIDVTPDQASKIEAFLAREHGAGQLVYGVHYSDQALMTCVVRDYADDHVHFIDGADGGYALAAKQMKAQLRERPAA